MKRTRTLLTLLVVLTMLLSIFAFSSCEWISGLVNPDNPNPPVGDTPTPPEHKHSFVDGKCECGETDPNYNPGDPTDTPTLSELDEKFYDAANWVYMTNNNGASLDGGDIPYTMADGSIKFHRANQAIEMGDFTNATVSFMLKATNDFSIWFNSSSIDNANNSSYRLNYAYGGLRIALSSAPEQAAAVISDENYAKGEWNRFDVVFSTNDGVCEIKVYINGVRAELSAGDNTTPMVSVSDNVLTHTQPAMFSTGNYMVVKVWEAHNYVQLKPVAKAEEEDLPIIACIGASITEGAGAGDFYLESYPAQLQNALGGLYNVVNFGNSGKTVRTDLGDDVAWLKQYQWQGVQAIVPDIAILNIGTNDSKTSNNPVSTYESFYAAYQHLIDELLKVNPDMQIVICTVPYAYSDIWDINNDNIANIIAPVQRAIAKEGGHTLIDLYEYSQDKAHLFPDGVHPNTRGYEMFVKIIKKAILEGGEALTEEFINEINEEYKAKVPNAYVTLDSVVIDNMTLTIKGTSNDSGIQLFVGQKPEHSNAYYPITIAEDGSFEIALDLKTLAIGSDWYNVRIYFTDGNYYTVSLDETKKANGDSYALWSWITLENTQIQICSWDEGGIPTLSFKVEEYIKPSFETVITGGSIEEKDGKIILTVTGTTTDSKAVLLVGPTDDPAIYGHAMEIAADGSFTATLDLTTLEISSSWQNVRIVMSDGKNVVVPYDKLGVKLDDVFYSDGKKVTIKTWGGENITSLSVEYYDPSYTLTPTEVKFENGKLVFSGTTTNVRSLVVYLYETKEANDGYNTQAVIAEDGSFTAEIGLEQLGAAAGNWYFLMVSVNEGERVKVEYSDYDATEFYGYGFRTYKWEFSGGIAVNYSNYDYSITNYSIALVDGKPTLTIEGIMKDATVAADTITLLLDKTSVEKQQITLTNLATEAGSFKFVHDISELIASNVADNSKEEGYFIRLYVNGSKKADVNSRWFAQDLFEEVELGSSTFYFYRNSLTAYNTAGIVRFDNSQALPVVNTTELKMENGKLIFSGNTKYVDSLVVSLFESDSNYFESEVELGQNGEFTYEFNLSDLTAAAGNWYYLKVAVNGGNATKVVVSYDSSYRYAFGYRTYKWENYEGIAVSYSNTGYSYTVTNATIVEIDGVPTLIIEGTTSDATIAAESLTLRLDKTAGTKEQLDVVNQATEAGTFKFVFDASVLMASTVAENTKEEGYFIRIFKNGTKFADINSAFLSNDLFEKVDIGYDTFYFYRNNASAYYTLGIVKFEKEENYDYYLVGGQVSATNMPFTLTQEGEKVYISFNGTFGASSRVERTIELIMTTEDPAERPTELDASKILYTAQNTYSGKLTNEFAFKINATDDVPVQNDWIRFVLKVTEGDTVSYYTIKPQVPSHNGDWIACADPITLGGIKYELAICWSSFLAQVKNG